MSYSAEVATVAARMWKEVVENELYIDKAQEKKHTCLDSTTENRKLHEPPDIWERRRKISWEPRGRNTAWQPDKEFRKIIITFVNNNLCEG